MNELLRTLKDLVVIGALAYVIIAANGCACIVGAARGGWEGARRDIAAAQSITAPGTPNVGYELPGPPPQPR